MRKYLLALIIGSILTSISHKVATIQRGYKALGGEFLIIPLLIIMMLSIKQIGEIAEETKKALGAENSSIFRIGGTSNG